MANQCRDLGCLYLAGCSRLTDEAGIAVATTCTRLTDLDISRCSKITNKGIMQIRGLTTFKLEHLPNITETAITTMLTHCPDIKHLSVNGCEKLADHFKLGLSASQPRWAPCSDVLIYNLIYYTEETSFTTCPFTVFPPARAFLPTRFSFFKVSNVAAWAGCRVFVYAAPSPPCARVFFENALPSLRPIRAGLVWFSEVPGRACKM